MEPTSQPVVLRALHVGRNITNRPLGVKRNAEFWACRVNSSPLEWKNHLVGGANDLGGSANGPTGRRRLRYQCVGCHCAYHLGGFGGQKGACSMSRIGGQETFTQPMFDSSYFKAIQ